MRRRVVRELGTALGIVVILAVVAFVNTQMRRGDLVKKYVSWRLKIEKEREDMGMDLLDWKVLQKTKGTRRTGPRFDEETLTFDGTNVDIIGFMNPIYEYRNMHEFILLPMPIECYFCEAPPFREVVAVQLAEGKGTDLFREPVLVTGHLTLVQGPGNEFFYLISNAQVVSGREKGALTRREIPLEHRLERRDERLYDGIEPTVPSAPFAPSEAPPE